MHIIKLTTAKGTIATTNNTKVTIKDNKISTTIIMTRTTTSPALFSTIPVI